VPKAVQPVTGAFWDLPNLTPDPRQPKRAFYYYVKRLGPDFLHGYSVFSTTGNGGRSWSKPRRLYDPKTANSWPARGKILVNRDGSLLNVFALISSSRHANPNAVPFIPTKELALRSVNGGRTWSKPITIGRTGGRYVFDPATGEVMNTYDTFPSQTVAPNGDVYVTWSQPGAKSSRIVVARSRNAGRTWTRHYLAVRGQAALPTIGVSGDGTVGVTYYSAAAASHNGFWPTRVVLALSRDHGGTWSRQRIGGPFNLLTTGSKARPCCFLGTIRASEPCQTAWSPLPQWESRRHGTRSTCSSLASRLREAASDSPSFKQSRPDTTPNYEPRHDPKAASQSRSPSRGRRRSRRTRHGDEREAMRSSCGPPERALDGCDPEAPRSGIVACAGPTTRCQRPSWQRQVSGDRRA
jgi:hypothetical protein